MESNQYSATVLAPDVWAIEDGGVRCFLVQGPQEAMLVDTGFGGGDLLAFIRTLTPLPVFLVNTHGDGDHIGCNHQFDRVLMHPAEFDRWSTKSIGPLPRPLWEGQVLTLGQYTFEVILIPGHTPGSIALLERHQGWLIAGDSVQAGTIYMFGPGRNLPAYLCSLEKLSALAGVEKIFPSHGPLPLAPSILPPLLQGGRDLLAGKLLPHPPDRDLPCQLYDCGVAKFYYQPPV